MEAKGERKIARQKKATTAKVATAAAVKYTNPGGLNFGGPKFKQRTPAERAAEKARVAARRKKRLQG